MKRLGLIIMTVLTVYVVHADLAINWSNWQIILNDNATPLLDGAKAQLIWSPTGITTTTPGAYNVQGGTMLSGEFLLAETVTAGWGAGAPDDYGLWNTVSGTYTDANVGGADIHTGYFFTRIFGNDGVVYGESFLDTGAVDASLWVFDIDHPGDTTYSKNAVPGTAFETIDLNSNNTTVIPEPGTFGLMGLAGLGLFMARRSALKKARRI